jgi:glutathione S-transferase/RNA polymerase-associated protein
MIKLYEHPFSPYAQKVKIALYEKNIPFEAEVPNAFAGSATDYGKTNPRLEVPALEDDGFPIFDSTIILQYLEDKRPEPAMLPRSAADRARVLMIEELCDTYYEPINWGLMEVTVWGRATGDLEARLVKRAAEQTQGVFAWLQRELGTRAFFNGEAFGHGDLSVYPFVRGSVVFGNAPQPGSPLAVWMNQVEQRKSVRKTNEAASRFQGSMTTLKEMLKSGVFKRQYRDHRLEWMMRSGGTEIVREGLANGTIRFSQEIL